ncbi:ABC transporter permease [Streptomyces sp. NPDC000594]|uniref:ABC transporter permease n=1 Tax=Streptomyces sp. NPDC000594 TaxID=3154261 RepID=UPI00333253BB
MTTNMTTGRATDITTNPRATTLALARLESRLLLRHPAFLGNLLLCAAVLLRTALTGAADHPVLHDADRALQLPLLLPAAGVLLATHLAVLRPARDTTHGWYAALTLPRHRRTAAHLLAVLPATAVTAALAALWTGWLALRPGAVGTPSPAELATGPAVVALAGALAVLLGSLTTAVATAPAVLVLVAAATMAGALLDPDWRWWTPVVFASPGHEALPSGLLHRPATAHLLYLLALTVAVGCAALLRTGPRPRRLLALTALALAVTTAAGTVQSRPAPAELLAARERAAYAPSGEQRCVRDGRITYCAFPEFLERHEQWAEVVHGVLRRVPERVRERPYAVRQHITPYTESSEPVLDAGPVDRWAEDDRRAGTEGAVAVGTAWGSGDDTATDTVSGFAAEFARRVVVGPHDSADGPHDGTGPADGRRPEQLCGGRALVTVWLAAQATPDTAPALRDRMRRSFGQTVFGFGPYIGVSTEDTDAETALRLLRHDPDRVAMAVREHWDELTDPATRSDRAARLLGVEAPERPVDPESPCART